MSRLIPTVEVAKIIRKRLKAAFPTVKFSVRKDSNSIDVTWTDGPTNKMVEAITGDYKGGGFDGMIDMGFSIDHWLSPDGSVIVARNPGTLGQHGTIEPVNNEKPCEGAELVHFGSKYISLNREFSLEMRNRALDSVRSKYHFETDVSDVRYICENTRWGEVIKISSDRRIPEHGKYLSEMVLADLSKRATVAPAR